MRTNQRLDCFCDVRARHQIFPVLLDQWKAQPTARTVYHCLAAAADKFERILDCFESHFLTATNNAGGQSVKLRNIFNSQIIVTAHFDDIPFASGEHDCCCERNPGRKKYYIEPKSRCSDHRCASV